MQSDEKLCLQWNDFKENVNTAFGKLREANDFSDVTLVCEDGKQLEAHQIILASSSPFFENLFRKKKRPSPMIFMRGVKYEDLLAILDFLYIGEANVFQENLDSFIAIAGELQLKGLTAESKDGSVKNEEQSGPENRFNRNKQAIKQIPLPPHHEDVHGIDQKNMVAKTVDTSISVDLEGLDDQINSMINLTEKVDQAYRKMVICNVCGHEGPRAFVVRHIEAKHITGVSHPCDICGKTARSRNALIVHKSTYHK